MASFTSVFDPYVRTNYIPTDLQRTEIKQVLVDPDRKAAKIQDDIAHLQLTLDRMTKEKQGLQNIIDKHRRLLSPFRRLSDDILGEIFLFCLPESHNATMDINEAPLVLGRICKRWRSVAYYTPRLWSTLHIPIPIHPNPSDDAYYPKSREQVLSEFAARLILHQEAVIQWLSRSGLCPLSLSFHPITFNLAELSCYYQPYLAILLLFSHRWRHLELTIPNGECSNFFSSISSSDVLMLDTLRIVFLRVWTVWDKPHDLNWESSGLLTAKNLRTLYLSSFPFPLSHITAQWSKLIRLELTDSRDPWQDTGLPIDEIHSLLSQCSSLVHLAVQICEKAGVVCSAREIKLNALESLDVLDHAPSLETLFQCLQTPSLRFIKYHTASWPSSQRRSPLLGLLLHSQNHLEELTTNIEFMTLQDLRECFELTPSLRRFRNEECRRGIFYEQSIGFNNFSDSPVDLVKAAFEFLIPDQDGCCFWPRLAEIDLAHPRRVSDQDVLRFIERRMELAQISSHVATLKKIKICFKHEMEHDIRPSLLRYTDVEDGIKLDLSYPKDKVAYPGNFRHGKALPKYFSMFDA